MRKTLKRNLSYDDRNHLYYVSLYYDGENGRRVRRTRTYPTMEQAEQVIAEYRRAQLLGGRSAPGDVFMEDWLRYWMDELIKPNCEETTCHGYENILNTHMIPSLGRLCVQDLTPVRVQQYYGELRRKGLANNTIRKHHVLLHAALGAAVRQGIVGANVTCLVTPPAREAPQHRFYDSSQLRMLFCASEGTPLEVAVKLAGCLGLRRSEICGLKWRNVDLKRGVLTVCEVRTAVSGRGRIRAQTPRMTKTLKMFDPTTLPIATSLLPAMAESTDTTSSGVEVPTATTVSPMMNSGTRNRCANAAEPSVRKFAPARISPRPMMRSKMSKL